MRIRGGLAVLIALAIALPAHAVVFINQVFINPAGSGTDDFYEFIELQGTPGKKLDGYALAFMNGYIKKFHPLGSIGSPNQLFQEIDEFMSLDGLALGPNGLLVLTVGLASDHPSLLADSNFRPDWEGAFLGGAGPGPIWNGGLDTTTSIQNDGSNTVMLIRNRPGETEATCPNYGCGDLRWGKDICHDCELFTPVDTTLCMGGFNPGDPCNGAADCLMGICGPGQADQWGDGNADKGQANGFGGFTLDMKGASTPMDVSDDLEIVDEVSYEDASGWEYDEDDRHVDNGSSLVGLPRRRVHELDDPQGFNPDCLTRVDYRTKGPGWPASGGGTGELPNGNNWQDTATEQWIRGESIINMGRFYLDIAANANVDAIQPYRTHVPLWLNDGVGAEFNFTTPFNYEITAGRVNHLAIPFIPGDSDRDGDCDAEDIAKIVSVFGDENWIFSNGFEDAPEGDSGDPAMQTRPWDVDATGDNGVEPSDLQWTLNFQGNTDGRIIGVLYDSETPSATGVVMNPNTGVQCTVTAGVAEACGRAEVWVGSLVNVTVSAQVTAGGNMTAGAQNGVMQYIHDVELATAGVLQFVGVEPLGTFATTRSTLESPQGTGGDLGVDRVNGYTTSFTQGLGSSAQLYRVTFKAVAAGSTTVSVGASGEARLAASTPGGLKIGHTRNLAVNAPNDISTTSVGDPASVSYPSPINVTVVNQHVGDINADSAFDIGDVATFTDVLVGANMMPGPVDRSDLNCDGLRNGQDIRRFVELFFE